MAKLLLQEAEETNNKSAQVEQLSKFVHEAYGTHRPRLNDLLSGLIDRLKRVRKLELPSIGHAQTGGGAIELDPKESSDTALLATMKAATDARRRVDSRQSTVHSLQFERGGTIGKSNRRDDHLA